MPPAADHRGVRSRPFMNRFKNLTINMTTANCVTSTPVNRISRENLRVLIVNNILNDSVEFASDHEMMDTNSPLRNPYLQPISKKLFHSPITDTSPKKEPYRRCKNDHAKRAQKRKQILIPSSAEKIKRVYVEECDMKAYSPEVCEGMRKRVLVSLFHNKEYSMDMSM